MKVLIAEPKDFSNKAKNKLQSIATVDCRAISQDEIGAALENYDVVWIRLGLTIRASMIDSVKSLRCKYVISATTGLNHIDLDYLKSLGIKVLSLKGEVGFLETITATAEHTIALMLALVRQIPKAHQSVTKGIWNRDLFKGHEVKGRTAAILGYGRLGKIVARYCLTFGMKVAVYDPFVTEYPKELQVCSSMEELFGCGDFVTIHIPLDASTEKIISKRLLEKMRPGAILINTSRGELLNESDLLVALNGGLLAGAALDVLTNEEFLTDQNPLISYAREHNNLLLTPHIGGCTYESMEHCEEFMVEKLFKDLQKNG